MSSNQENLLKNNLDEVKTNGYQEKLTKENLDKYRARGYSEVLLPKTTEKRNSSLKDYFTLWMGNLHNIPNYASVGGFLVLGLAPINVMLALIVGAITVGILFAYQGKFGSKYGLPFSMHLRSAYGERGAKLPGTLRGIIAAIGWFGLQTYVGSQALLILVAEIWPGILEIGGDTMLLGISIPGLIMFILFWLLNVVLGMGETDFLNKFNTILTVLIYVLFVAMAFWGLRVGGGFGNILSYAADSSVSTPTILGYLLVINAVLGFWAAPVASVSDNTQNAESTDAQMKGQIIGVVVGYLVFAVTSMTILIGATIHYGVEQWDVLEIINRWDSLPAIFFATLVLLLITINSNVVANLNPSGFQLAALFPGKIDKKKGVILAAVVGAVILPWKLMENPDSIYSFLNAVGAALGPIVGVMLYHYYVIDEQEVDLDELLYDLNDKDSKNKYRGTNVNAIVATLIGMAVALIGNFIPALSLLSQLSWISGFIAAVVSYALLMKFRSEEN